MRRRKRKRRSERDRGPAFQTCVRGSAGSLLRGATAGSRSPDNVNGLNESRLKAENGRARLTLPAERSHIRPQEGIVMKRFENARFEVAARRSQTGAVALLALVLAGAPLLRADTLSVGGD